jgi:hypothetical protein
MSSNGILLTFWTISAICGCSSLSVPARSACARRRRRRSTRSAAAGDEVERDVELAGEQVAGAQLRAQAAGDELLQDDGVAGAAGVAQQRLAHRAEPERIDLGQDLDREAMALRVVLERDAADAADVDAEQVDSGARRQAAHRLVEDHPHRHGDAVGRRERRAAIGKEREDGVLGRLRPRAASGGESKASRRRAPRRASAC